MTCPVCKAAVDSSQHAFCPQCAWDLKNDLTLNTYLGSIPEMEMSDYRQRLEIARKNWEYLQQMKEKTSQRVQQQQPPQTVSQKSNPQSESPKGKTPSVNGPAAKRNDRKNQTPAPPVKPQPQHISRTAATASSQKSASPSANVKEQAHTSGLNLGIERYSFETKEEHIKRLTEKPPRIGEAEDILFYNLLNNVD